MKINKSLFDLLSLFNKNWEQHKDRLYMDLSEEEIGNIETHPLSGELINLINKKGGSLPYFSSKNIIWCTMAPNSFLLQKEVEQLQAWVLPSYGWQGKSDGYKIPDPNGDTFQKAIYQISPTNYFRWQSKSKRYSLIEHKLSTRYKLETKRPERRRRQRPSLYELRTQFKTALMLGDRNLAEKAIDMIDTYEFDKALNTQMMRIHLWHHFREFELIKNYRNLSHLRNQPSLPNIIKECIKEALGKKDLELKIETKEEPAFQPKEMGVQNDWELWFEFLIKNKDLESARTWLEEKEILSLEEITIYQIESYSEYWDSLFVDDELREQNKLLINEGLVTFLGDFVREPKFPRKSFAKLYLSLLRLWGKMNAGIGRGREDGHVLLELANSLFQLNYEIDESKSIIEEWWDVRPVPSQLPFALDTIELLATQHPDPQAPENLWFKAADIARRYSQQLLESEKVLWRDIGLRIGFEEADIQQYFPIEQKVVSKDLLTNANFKKIAIVCMRERQARDAAKIIQARTGVEVLIVSTTVAGIETDHACACDVVLFVWMASTHAVFRAFDEFDRRKLFYVQGTGSASIVRALERWTMKQLN